MKWDGFKYEDRTLDNRVVGELICSRVYHSCLDEECIMVYVGDASGKNVNVLDMPLDEARRLRDWLDVAVSSTLPDDGMEV